MSSPDLQAKANQLNARMQEEATKAIDQLEKTLIRPIARNSYACVVKCYDDAGTTNSAEQIDQCSKHCQGPYQASHQVLQQEIGQVRLYYCVDRYSFFLLILVLHYQLLHSSKTESVVQWCNATKKLLQ